MTKKKYKKQIKHLRKQIKEKQISKKQQRKEHNRIFNKYHISYNAEKDMGKRKAEIKRERYVYDKLNEKQLESTAIEKLLDMTLEDMECQYAIKAGIENKAVCILALWGILFTVLINNDGLVLSSIIKKFYYEFALVIEVIVVLLLALTGSVALFYICRSIKPHEYKKFMFDEKEYNFSGAVDDKNMTYTVLLDVVTNSWIENRKVINSISENFHKAIGWVIAFAIMLIVCYGIFLF